MNRAIKQSLSSALTLLVLFGPAVLLRASSTVAIPKANSPLLAENQAQSPVTSDIDLVGLWNIKGDPNQQIRIGFPGQEFLIIANLSVDGWGAAKIPYVGPYHGGAAKLPVMKEEDYKKYGSLIQAMDDPPQVVIVDSEHLLIGNKSFVRSNIPEFQRRGCAEAASSTTIRPNEALNKAYELLRGKQFDTAACWLLIGALEGSGRTSAALAEAYFEGKGFPQSDEKALVWFQQSAAQGFYYSEMNLSQMYQFGKGTTVDPKKAFQWKHLAQEQQNAQHLQAVADAQARAQNAVSMGMLLFGLSILTSPQFASPPQVNVNFNVTPSLSTSFSYHTMETPY